MLIDRRDFIAGTILAGVTRAIQLLPPQHSSSAASQSRAVFMIRGWSVEEDSAGANHVWITVHNSWRAAWR